MFKRIMSVMLAVVMLMSVAMVAASAAQVEIADNSADAVADVAAGDAADTGAEGDTAETGSAHTFTFDVNSAGWNNYKKIHCYIWEYGTENKLTNWQEKKNQCKDNGDGTWTFDLDAKGLSIADGVLYCVIFSADTGMQTYDLLLDTTCFGDTAYCNGDIYENPADSNKTSQAAVWKGQDPTVLGPVKCITSIGNVVGTCLPRTVSAQSMFETFLKETLINAREYSGKDDQTLLDDTAKALELYKDDVEAAIKNTGVEVAWDKEKSTLSDGSNPSSTEKGDGTNPGNNGNNSNNSSSSTTKTGSGSTTKTGQETTVLFIMLGVMIAAAGVVVLARKERA